MLNGVEFLTRHNDYALEMKSRSSDVFGATEPIPFPLVPPEVLEQPTVAEQIAEMRRWFKAWADQDHSVRDYRPYFRPVMCYLEAAWMHSNDSINEPFDSDRHFLDAQTWLELQEKIRFCASTGHKSSLENLAYLPTTITGQDQYGKPILAQWNYRIGCHPLSRDLPLNRFRVVDDVKARMKLTDDLGRHVTLAEFAKQRAARFQLNPIDRDLFTDQGRRKYSLLDQLMYEIPGMNNYGSVLRDEAFGEVSKHYDTSVGDLNAAYYHRIYRVQKLGAMGSRLRARGFSDPSLYMAMTDQPTVANVSVEQCRRRQCQQWTQSWSYAIPLEVIYMTPLSEWNPLEIQYRGEADDPEAQEVYASSTGVPRTGENHPDLAYNGTHSKLYYRTPVDFFSGESDVATGDTTKDSLFVLDQQGRVQETRASGFRVFLPHISGVGVLRQRYPILPVHGEGAGVWKELSALEEITMTPTSFPDMLKDHVPVHPDNTPDTTADTTGPPTPAPPLSCALPQASLAMIHAQDALTAALEEQLALGLDHGVVFLLPQSAEEYGHHSHHLTLTPAQLASLCQGDLVTARTHLGYSHQHDVTVKRAFTEVEDANGRRATRVKYVVTVCDGERSVGSKTCEDRHDRKLLITEEQDLVEWPEMDQDV